MLENHCVQLQIDTDPSNEYVYHCLTEGIQMVYCISNEKLVLRFRFFEASMSQCRSNCLTPHSSRKVTSHTRKRQEHEY